MKKFICMMLALVVCIAFAGCAKEEDPVKKDLETIKVVANVLEDELTEMGVDKEMVDNVLTTIEEYNETAEYVIAFDIESEAYPVLNMTLHFPVDKAFFDSVEVGDVIDNEIFSAFHQLDGALDDFTITVGNKIAR